MELEAVLLSCVGSNNGICAGFGVHTSLKSSVLLLSYCSDPLADPARTDSSRGRSSKRIGKSPSNLSAQIECVEAQTLLELDVGDERFVSVSVCHSPGSSMNGAEPRIVIIGATQRSLHRWAFTYESASSTGLSLTEQISSSLFMISYEECEAAVRSVTLSSSGTFVAVVQGSKAVVYGEGLERELVADLSAASKAELRRVPHQNVSGSNYGRVVDVQFIEDEANPHLLTLHSSGIVMLWNGNDSIPQLCYRHQDTPNLSSNSAEGDEFCLFKTIYSASDADYHDCCLGCMVVGCRSGALLLSQIVKHASVPNRNNAERLRNVFSNSEDKLKEDVGAALQYSAKECASIDLARQLRSFSPVVGGSTACLPLSVTFADNKTQSGRGILCGTLIVAMLQSVAFIQMQGYSAAIFRLITFDRDIIPTITAVSAVALDVSCSSSMDALNSFLCVTLLTAFTKEMRCFTVPLESAVNENNYAAVEKTASDMAFQAKAVKLGRKDCELSNISLVDDSSSSKRRSKWNSDEALPAVLRGEVPAQSQESTENRNRSDSFVEPEEMIFNGFPPRRSYSYYSDETIPISLFLTNDLGEYLQLLEESQSEQTDDGNEVDHSSSEKQAEKIKLYIYSDGSIANNSLQGKSSETSSAKLSDKSKSSAKSWESPQVDLKTGKIIDQPILFHSRKIKSSGYGQTPNNVMDRFAKMRRERLRNQRQDSHHINNLLPRSLSAPMRRHSISGESNTIGSKGMGTKIDSSGAKKLRVYPLACGAMTQQQSHHNYPVAGEKAVGIHSKHGIAPSIDGQVGSISKICFNKDGSLLAIASTDAIVSTLKLPVATNKGEAVCYTGHNSRVTDVCFSLHRGGGSSSKGSASRNELGSVLLTASADCSARLWRLGYTDCPIATLTHTYHQPLVKNNVSSSSQNYSISLSCGISTGPSNATARKTGKVLSGSLLDYRKGATALSGNSRNKPFGDEVKAAQFFYQDKFVVLVVKGVVYMYTVGTDESEVSSNDLVSRRLATIGKYQCQTAWNMTKRTGAKAIQAISCLNSIQSPLIFCSTSDKKLHVLDATVGEVCRTFDAVHDKAIHCIGLPQPSLHVNQSADCYNFFTTSATDNKISLWDLRTAIPIGQLSGHVNTREYVGAAISPCLKYVATGSEDRYPRIFDIRRYSSASGGSVSNSTNQLFKLSGHRDVVSDVAFHPLLPQLATASYDGNIRFFVDPTHNSSF